VAWIPTKNSIAAPGKLFSQADMLIVARHLRFGDPKTEGTWRAEVDVHVLLIINYVHCFGEESNCGSRDFTSV